MLENLTLTQAIKFTQAVKPDEAVVSKEGRQVITRTFYEQFGRGLHPGAQLVVLRHGQVVVDLAHGIANMRRKDPVLPTTPFLIWSTTKPFTAMCIHHLVEQGKICLDAPIADYWPEFGCKGKQNATVRHALIHQAGIPKRGLIFQMFLWPRWKLVSRNVARLKAEYKPGTQTAYHTVNFGFILGEIVRRVSGEPIRVYMHEHFLQPLGLTDTALGLPQTWRQRAAGIYSGHKEQNSPVFIFNLPRIRSAVIPAATLHSTARNLAIFFQMLLNGGIYGGRQYLQPQTIQNALTLQYEGPDQTIGRSMRWALGFHLGGEYPGNDLELQPLGRRSTIHTFGHAGQGSCIAWADPDAQLVLAFTCNRLLFQEDSQRRWAELANAVWEAI